MAKESTDKGRGWLEKAADFLAPIPVVGPVLAAVVKHFGPRALLWCLFGFAFAFALFYFRLVPLPARVSDWTCTTPNRINVTVVKDPTTDWRAPYRFWLEKEADLLRERQETSGYMVAVIESETLAATCEYKWVLNASPGFILSGFGFRSMLSGSSQRFEPLPVAQASRSGTFVAFRSAKYHGEYKLIAVLQVSWKREDLRPDDFLTTIHSQVN